MDANSGNIGRAVNQIAASGWALYDAMHELTSVLHKKSLVMLVENQSTRLLKAYNISRAEK